MTEKYIEQQLCKKIKTMGGIAAKFVSPGFDGVPDRLILLPSRRVFFAETKAPGKKLRKLQERRKRQLESLGFKVFVIDSLEGIEEMIKEVTNDF